MRQAVSPRVLAGVSTRDYRGVLDAVCDGYGIERSSVSRHWKAASMAELRRLMERPLGELNLVAILIDGIEFHGFLLVVALGIDAVGRKHVLGLWPGATENTEVVQGLLADLLRRGLRTDQPYLFVLDGSAALHKAVQKTFGRRAVVQRCQVHKERNVLGYLPPENHATVRQRLRAAWGLKKYADARAALVKLVEYLAELSVSASRSLEEGLEETMTLHRLGVPESLRRTLRSTNPIESCFSTTRELCQNVKRWRSEEMTQRWAATMLLQSERRMRRIKGHRELPIVIAGLQGIETQAAAA
jgi:transposase-like protein